MKTRSKTMTDLTTGEPIRVILGFALPLLGGILFQQFYSFIDMMIVGRFLGVNALAGVGSTGSINFMIIGFCMGVCNGFAIPISQRFGAKDYSAMRRFWMHGIYLSLIFSVVMTAATVFFCGDILRAMNTPEGIFDNAYRYILVIFWGIPFTYLCNLTGAAIRALGDSKAPVVFLIVSSVVNIGLDLLLILVIPMGVVGAAVATVISQALSGVMAVVYIWKKVPLLHTGREERKPQRDYFTRLLFMGLPMGLQYSITAIGSVILQTAVNSLGAVYVAAMTAGGKVSNLLCTPFDALGSTMATFGGQNTGAGKIDRLTKGLGAASILGSVYAVVIFVVLFLFGSNLTGLFISADSADAAQVMALSRQYLVFVSAFYVPLLFVNIVRFMIQGMGYSGRAILAGVCEMVGRMIAALILIPIMGFTGACLASPVAWIAADAFLIPTFFALRKKVARMLGQAAT